MKNKTRLNFLNKVSLFCFIKIMLILVCCGYISLSKLSTDTKEIIALHDKNVKVDLFVDANELI